MGNMTFLPELQAFLERNKLIYTVRSYQISAEVVLIDGIGLCTRLPMGMIGTKKDLLPYLEDSGFTTVDDWWAKIRYFIPGAAAPKYLYKVTVLDE